MERAHSGSILVTFLDPLPGVAASIRKQEVCETVAGFLHARK